MRAHHFIYLLFKWLIIPCVLLVFGVLFVFGFFHSFLQNSNEPISVITYSKAPGDMITPMEKPLMKGEIITGEFVAKSNNLGTLAIRFGTYKRAGSDVIIFKIKEKNEKDWYYQTNYKVDQFQDNELFTFGFPVIANSEGKIYDFQIESTLGRKNDAIYVSSREPIFVTKYKYSLKYAVRNIGDTVTFLKRKIIIPSPTLKDVLQQLLYLTPLIFYVFFALFSKNLGAKVYYGCLLLLIIFVVLSPQFNVLTLQDFRTIAVFWMMGILIYRLKSEVTFLLGGILVSLSFAALLFGNNYISEKIAIFVYWSLVVAMIELILEVATRRRFKRGYKKFLNLLFTK